MKLTGWVRGASALAAVAALAGTGCAAARDNAASDTAAATKAADRAAVGAPMSSLGIGFYNNSSDNLVLQSTSGPNEGVPGAGSALTSGKGSDDFEVTFRAAKTTTVSAHYTVQSLSGAALGSVAVDFSVDALGARSVSGGSSALGLTTAYVGNGNWELEDSAHTAVSLDATDTRANAVVQQFCNDANNSAQCTFTPSSNTPSTKWALLASGYTSTGGDGKPSTISVSSGYDDQTSVNSGGSVSAGLKLGKVLSIGVSEAYDRTLAFDTIFTATESLDVAVGQTGYIWGHVPVIQYTGTMKVVVGNTTWTISDMIVTSPDASRSLTSFQVATFAGNYPIGRPDQPPASD